MIEYTTTHTLRFFAWNDPYNSYDAHFTSIGEEDGKTTVQRDSSIAFWFTGIDFGLFPYDVKSEKYLHCFGEFEKNDKKKEVYEFDGLLMKITNWFLSRRSGIFCLLCDCRDVVEIEEKEEEINFVEMLYSFLDKAAKAADELMRILGAKDIQLPPDGFKFEDSMSRQKTINLHKQSQLYSITCNANFFAGTFPVTSEFIDGTMTASIVTLDSDMREELLGRLNSIELVYVAVPLSLREEDEESMTITADFYSIIKAHNIKTSTERARAVITRAFKEFYFFIQELIEIFANDYYFD